jgi:CRISP-associated protein Cas1
VGVSRRNAAGKEDGFLDDLHLLPKVRDALSYLYVEHARIDRHEKSIAIWTESGHSPVPAASLALLMLGPGTTVTHGAVQALADNNCLLVWCGEENVRFYAFGTGGTRSGAPLLHQARLVSDETTRLEVVKRMYRMRFSEWPGDGLTIEQLRGMEGARMRKAYASAAKAYNIPWEGRNYDRDNWDDSDLVNRALSCANACLYGLCHAAILSTGYSPGLGFVHTGKQLSFVYDMADLYKTEITIPVAFEIAAYAPPNIERATRLKCRDRFRTSRLLARIVPDIQKLLGVKDGPGEEEIAPIDTEKALPGQLWGPSAEGGSVAGGVAYTDPALDDGSEDGPFGPDPGWRETWGFLGPAKKKPEEPTP